MHAAAASLDNMRASQRSKLVFELGQMSVPIPAGFVGLDVDVDRQKAGSFVLLAGADTDVEIGVFVEPAADFVGAVVGPFEAAMNAEVGVLAGVAAALVTFAASAVGLSDAVERHNPPPSLGKLQGLFADGGVMVIDCFDTLPRWWFSRGRSLDQVREAEAKLM